MKKLDEGTDECVAFTDGVTAPAVWCKYVMG